MIKRLFQCLVPLFTFVGTRYRPYLQADGQPTEHVPESALHQPPHHIPLRRETLLLQEGFH